RPGRVERAAEGRGVAVVPVLAGRELAVHIVVVLAGQADLLEVVGALGAGGSLADLLDGGQEQADEDRDDRNHHQQLDQRERTPGPGQAGPDGPPGRGRGGGIGGGDRTGDRRTGER